MLISVNLQDESLPGNSVHFRRAPAWQIIALAAIFAVVAFVCFTCAEPRVWRLPLFLGLFVGAIVFALWGGCSTDVQFDRGHARLIVERRLFAWSFKRQTYDYGHVALSIQVLTSIISRGNAPRPFQGYVITAGTNQYLLGLPPRFDATQGNMSEVQSLLGLSKESSLQSSNRNDSA